MLRAWEELVLDVPDPIRGADELEGLDIEGDAALNGEIDAYVDGVVASDQLTESTGELPTFTGHAVTPLPAVDVGAAIMAELNGTAPPASPLVTGIASELEGYEVEGDDETGAVDLEGEENEHPVMAEFKKAVAAVAGPMDLAGTVDGIDEFGDEFAGEVETGCCGIL